MSENEAGRLALKSLKAAAELCRDGLCDALVTAPVKALIRACFQQRRKQIAEKEDHAKQNEFFLKVSFFIEKDGSKK